MEWLTPVLTALIAKFDPITLVLLIMLGCCGWWHIIVRKEDREDKNKMLDIVKGNSDALTNLKMVMSAISGKPMQ